MSKRKPAAGKAAKSKYDLVLSAKQYDTLTLHIAMAADLTQIAKGYPEAQTTGSTLSTVLYLLSEKLGVILDSVAAFKLVRTTSEKAGE